MPQDPQPPPARLDDKQVIHRARLPQELGDKGRITPGPPKVTANSRELGKSAVILLELVTIVSVFIPPS